MIGPDDPIRMEKYTLPALHALGAMNMTDRQTRLLPSRPRPARDDLLLCATCRSLWRQQ